MPVSSSISQSITSQAEPKVFFFYHGIKISLANRSQLKAYIQKLFRKEGKKLGVINYIFCSDKALLRINRQFLAHDFYTDIITFELSESDEVQAEVYISVDRVRENASVLGVSLKSELHRVIFHGALHLCGYKDKTSHNKKEMREKEDFYLRAYIN